MCSAIAHPDIYHYYNQLSALPLEQWNKLIAVSRIKKFAKKQMLFQTGDKVENIQIVLSGLVRMYYQDSAGKEFTRAFKVKCDSASAFGELLQGIASRLNACAIEDSEILEFSYLDFQKLSMEHSCWERISLKILMQHFLMKEKREYELLVLDASERYQSFVEEYPDLIKRVPQYQIASYLGVTPVTLSRLLN